jgi:hypothetical protein
VGGAGGQSGGSEGGLCDTGAGGGWGGWGARGDNQVAVKGGLCDIGAGTGLAESVSDRPIVHSMWTATVQPPAHKLQGQVYTCFVAQPRDSRAGCHGEITPPPPGRSAHVLQEVV